MSNRGSRNNRYGEDGEDGDNGDDDDGEGGGGEDGKDIEDNDRIRFSTNLLRSVLKRDLTGWRADKRRTKSENYFI